MKKRVISGVAIAVAVVVLGLIGSYPLYVALMLCSAIGYLELASAVCPREGARENACDSAGGNARGGARESGRGNARCGSGERAGSSGNRRGGMFSLPAAPALPGLLLTPVLYAGMMYIEWRYGVINYPQMAAAADRWTLFLLALDFLLTMGIYVFTFPKGGSLRALGAFASFLYAPVLMSFACRTRTLPLGIYLYLLTFVCSSVSDVCALFAGMTFGRHGRHKLAPVLSPKKTIEGAVGGVLGSTAVSCLVAFVLRSLEPGKDYLLPFALIGAFGSVIAQIGDLSASAIKRDTGIKDYGDLIPGHGGIMDRFDSILFISPAIYYLSLFLMGKL